VILDDGRVHVVLCARDPEAPALRQGAVAHLVSDDMKDWTVLPPLFAPRHHYEIECPQLFTFGEHLYLTAAVLEERLQRYWVADSIEGSFRSLDHHVLMPPGCYAARVCSVGDERWIFGFHDPGGARGVRDRVIPSALTLAQTPDGSLACRRAAGWDALAGPAETLEPERLEARFATPGAGRDGNAFVAEAGMELFACARPADALAQLDVSIEAPLAGVVLELRPGGGGLFVELDRGPRRARVVEYGSATEDDHPWFRRRVLAEGAYEPAPRFELEVIYAGGEVVLSMGGRAIVSTHHRPSGGTPSIGLLVESGRVRVESASVRALRL
jgi:hypothetical protein